MKTFLRALLSGLLTLGVVTSAGAYNYDNEARNTALMMESCQKALAEAKNTPAQKKETCTCFIIGISASGPTTIEVKSLVENGFMGELMRLNRERTGGWNPAIRKCFR